MSSMPSHAGIGQDKGRVYWNRPKLAFGANRHLIVNWTPTKKF